MDILNVYYSLPVWLQNICVSVYGFVREKRRYGGDFKKRLCYFENTKTLSKTAVQEYQRTELRKLLKAADRSQYYHNLFLQLGIDMNGEDSFEILKKMPILTKEQVRGREEYFYTQKRKTDQVFHTSGSTGTPLNIRMSIEDFRDRMALLERMKREFGISHKTRHISFVGKKISKNGCFWRKNVFGNQLVMSVYDLSERNKEEYIKKIKKYNATMVEGYPSALEIISKWLIEEKVKLNVKCVLTTAETLSEEQRNIIEKGFGCVVVNYYGSSEGAPLIFQCKQGNLHLCYESGIIEFLDENYNSAKNGDVARMVVTSFSTKAMPLIRYDIGDMAVVGNYGCLCGNKSPVIKEILGRVDDVFETKEKGKVGRLSTSLKLLPPTVRKAQIQQHGIDDFLVLIESDIGLTEKEKLLFCEDLVDKLGHVNIKLEVVDAIPTGKNGKFRTQIKMF